MTDDQAKETALILPFGKHKGERIDQVMRADPGWVEWVMAQPWFREKHPTLLQVIVNGGGLADADTPEHNRLQASFLDPAICAAAYRSIVGDAAIEKQVRAFLQERVAASLDECCEHGRGDEYGGYCHRAHCPHRPFRDRRVEGARRAGVAPYEARIAEARKQWEAAGQAASDAHRVWLREAGVENKQKLIETEKNRDRASALLNAMADGALNKGEEAAKAKVEAILASGTEHAALFAKIAKKVGFEVYGWDVVLDTCPRVNIELKPTVGDDYPSILRKMKTRIDADGRWGRAGVPALIVDRFDAEGATFDQVVKMFAASGVAVRTLAEVQALRPVAAPPAVRVECFEDLVGLARMKRDLEVVRALESNVRPVRFEEGVIAISLVDAAPGLAEVLARRLWEWTGERWLVSIVGATEGSDRG